MLVRLVAGARAGENVHMDAIAANGAIETGVARHLTPEELEEHGANVGYRLHGEDVAREIRAAAPVERLTQVAAQPRKGGWPKGKPRGPRKTQTLL